MTNNNYSNHQSAATFLLHDQSKQMMMMLRNRSTRLFLQSLSSSYSTTIITTTTTRLASSTTPTDEDVDLFFSSDDSDFLSLLGKDGSTNNKGTNLLLVNRLENQCQLKQPSAVQSVAYDAILSGKDVTIGAETGSGKTYAYLLPLIQDVLLQKQQQQHNNDNRNAYEYCRAIILVPNKELAQQVVRMAAPLCGGLKNCLIWGAAGDGSNADNHSHNNAMMMSGEEEEEQEDIVRLAILPGGLSEPVDFKPFRDALHGDASPVDLLVATPAALGPWALSPKNVDFFEDVQTLIIDEADMLLDGGYLRPLQNVLMGFRRADRLAARYHSTSFHNNDDDTTASSSGPVKTQHVFVGATLPDSGLKSVDAFLQKRFPRSERVIMPSMHNAAHYGHSQKNMWIPDDPEDLSPNKARLTKLVQMLQSEDDLKNDKVMVFLNTVQDVDAATNALLRAGIEAVPYHAKIKLAERMENLQQFRGTPDNNNNHTNNNVVLVCTDLAARGLDVPGVTAVVQLQFATNVVTHLHRMGRCGRAGIRNGKSVVFHSTIEQEAEMVKVVQAAEESRSMTSLKGNDVLDDDDDDDDDQHEEQQEKNVGKINNAFSRKRGFTKKRKKLARNERERRQNNEEYY